MKRILSIAMIISTILIGGMTIEAKAPKKNSKSSGKPNTSLIQNWLKGKWVNERIDYTYYEVVYLIFNFVDDTYSFDEIHSDSGRASRGPKIKYYVKGDLIYNASSKDPIFRIDKTKNALIHLQSDRVYLKK